MPLFDYKAYYGIEEDEEEKKPTAVEFLRRVFDLSQEPVGSFIKDESVVPDVTQPPPTGSALDVIEILHYPEIYRS